MVSKSKVTSVIFFVKLHQTFEEPPSQLDNGACLAGGRLSGPIMRIIGNYPQLRLVLFVLCRVQQTISAGLRPY